MLATLPGRTSGAMSSCMVPHGWSLCVRQSASTVREPPLIHQFQSLDGSHHLIVIHGQLDRPQTTIMNVLAEQSMTYEG